MLFQDKEATDFAIAGARSLAAMYNPTLKLIPLGAQAEEGDDVSNVESSIDSLHASPFLLWAAQASGDEKMRQIARQHAASVIRLHQRKDNSFIQSSTLDTSGKLVRHHTHKGYSDTSTWGRAQVWGTLFSTMGYLRAREETSWLDAAQRGADWWIAHLPKDHVTFWDFNDPAIPNTERDTAATVAASSALLKLAKVAKDEATRSRYQAAAEATIEALVTKYLTPTSPGDKRIPGILTESCFNKRADFAPMMPPTSASSFCRITTCWNACWCLQASWTLPRCNHVFAPAAVERDHRHRWLLRARRERPHRRRASEQRYVNSRRVQSVKLHTLLRARGPC